MIKLPKCGGRRVGDWMKFHCGELVYDKADPRHLGVVTAIRNGYSARVVWEDTGWISWVPLVDLRNGGEK